MTPILLDTHAWAWSIGQEWELSPAAAAAIEDAPSIFVSPVSLFEIGQKVRIGKWPAMASLAPDILRRQGGHLAALTDEIALHASLRTWKNRDPFDRMIASTAELLGLSLVTKDPAFAGLPGLRVIW